MKKAPQSRIDFPFEQSSKIKVIEKRHSETTPFCLERVYCKKKCNISQRDPYRYGYWQDGSKMHSRYMGMNLNSQRL